jgi:hypothetical protein
MENQITKLQSQIGGIESQILQAAKNYPQIQTETGQNSLKNSLRYVMTLTGLKPENFPSEFETEILIDFLKSNFGKVTTEEIRLAFKMALAGNLDVETNHFQNFCAAYVAKILNAYLAKQKPIMFDANRIIPQKTEPTESEKQKIFWNFVEICVLPVWDEHQCGAINWSKHDAAIIYDALQKMDFSLTPDEKKQIAITARKQIFDTIKNAEPISRQEFKEMKTIRELMAANQIPKSVDDQILLKCKQFAVEKIFQNILQGNGDFAEIVKQIKNDQYEN